MSNAPIITFTDGNGNAITTLNFAQSTLGSNFLPVLQGESSFPVKVRVYNNYGLAALIASAINLNVTIFDGAGAGSHTHAQSVAGQCWIRAYESGFGENSSPPGLYTAWAGADTAIGGLNTYTPEIGSDGLASDQIRAGTDKNGVGFIEFELYAQIPAGAGTANYTFAFSVDYEYITP